MENLNETELMESNDGQSEASDNWYNANESQEENTD